MKKLIMFVMVLAIVTPAIGEDIIDLQPPSWAGAPGTLYGYWDFAEALWGGEGEWRIDPAKDQLMVPHGTNPDPEEFDDGEGGYMYQYWTGGDAVWHEEYDPGGGIGIREGVLVVNAMSFDMNNFAGDGTKLVRLQFVHTGGQFEGLGWGWFSGAGEQEELEDWPYGVIAETVLDDGWIHTTVEVEIAENPVFEYIEFGVEGETATLAIDQAIIDTICYIDPLPTSPGRGSSAKIPAIVSDPNITVIYEPEDPDLYGPEVVGPVVGNFGVKLGWQPVEVPGEPPVTVTVTLDPNTEGDKAHDDYKILGGDPVDGTLTLVFDANNYNVLQKVNIEAIKDTDREGSEGYTLGLTSVCNEDPCFQNAAANLRITVVDNDVPYVSALPEDIALSENNPGVIKTIEVRLSHQPMSDVEVFVGADGEGFFEDDQATKYIDEDENTMFTIDPNFVDWKDPNRLTFTIKTAGTAGQPETWTPAACGDDWDPATLTSCWNVPITISIQAVDNDVLGDAWVPFTPGVVFFDPLSEDLWYLLPSQNPDGSTFIDNPATTVVETSGGKGEGKDVEVRVEDNECGAWGYPSADVAGAFDTEGESIPDCFVGLADVAAMYIPWLECTEPYEEDCCKVWERDEDTGECPEPVAP